MELQELIRQIQPVDLQAQAACLRHWDMIAKPLNSLGKLETMLARAAAVTGSALFLPERLSEFCLIENPLT